MPNEAYAYLALPKKSIQVNDTTPNPGKIGSLAWSTAIAEIVRWDGVSWKVAGSSSTGAMPPTFVLPDTAEQVQSGNNGLKLHAMDLVSTKRLYAAGAGAPKDIGIQPFLGDVYVSYGWVHQQGSTGIHGTGHFFNFSTTGTGETNNPATGSAGPASGVLRSTVRTVNTAGASAGFRAYYQDQRLFRGHNAWTGGFLLRLRFGYGGVSTVQFTAGCRAFVGVHDRADIPVSNADIPTQTTGFGICCDAGETNWSLYSGANSAAYTKTPLGNDFPVGLTSAAWAATYYELVLFCRPGVAKMHWRLRALHSTPVAEASGIFTNAAHMPAGNRQQYPTVWVNNGATTTTPACFLTHMYAEIPNF